MHHNPNRDEGRKEKSVKKTMTTWTRRVTLGAFITMNLALGAAEPPKVTPPNEPNVSSASQWTLTTDDTHLNLSVANHRISIDSLKNPKQNWNWTPVASEVPLIKSVVINGKPQSPDWKYQNATVDRTTGTTVTLTFSSTAPQLELKSIWRARPGVGPVEHRIDIVNKTAGAVVFTGDDIEAANLNLVADKPVQFFPHDAGKVGYGENTPLPYQIVKVGSAHGIYFAYDYGCGQYRATRDSANPLRLNCRFWVGNGVSTTIAAGETFHLPGIMIQTYQGDEDDAANRFRKWFWNYEITPSLRNNPNEPPIELCNPPGPDGNPDFLVNQAKTNDFASWGVGCLKTDAWHWMKKHAKSDEIAAALHAKGIKLSLYWSGPVREEDLLAEAAKSHFDYYRSDCFGTPVPFKMHDYHSVEEFKRKLDALAKVGVGWENCCGGGRLRSLDICRRMTFMTHSDGSGLIPFFVHVYHWSYMMAPIQLKSDYPIGSGYGTTVADIRGYLLGAILSGFPADPVYLSKLDDIKKVFQLYNTKQRPILRGADVYRILPPPAIPDPKAKTKTPAKGPWFGLQYYNTFINKGSVLLWQNGGPASQIIKLKGLDRSATYTLTFEDATEKNGSMTGAKLMDDGVEVPMGPNASEIIWIENPNGKPESKPAAP